MEDKNREEEKNFGNREDDFSLDILKEEEGGSEEFFKEPKENKKPLFFLVMGIIAFALCGISFILGIKLGRSLEKKQQVMMEEELVSSSTRIQEKGPLSPPVDQQEISPSTEKTGVPVPTNGLEEKPSSESTKSKDSTEFMILQNTKATPQKTPEPTEKIQRESQPVDILEDQQKAQPTPVVQKTDTTKTQNTPSGKMFTIQIGSSEVKQEADKLLKTYILKGYDAYISSGVVNYKTYYRVRIGKYSSEEIAKKAAEELKTKENLKEGKIWVTKE
jgi:cell division protein FtsN